MKVEFSGPAYALEVYLRHGSFVGNKEVGQVDFAIHSPNEPGDLISQERVCCIRKKNLCTVHPDGTLRHFPERKSDIM